MITKEMQAVYYQALLEKDPAFEGIFIVGITTTGIFCRPTCSARKPKFAHCEFFKLVSEALHASYRPCKRCNPLSLSNLTTPLIQKLLDAVEVQPEKRWTNRDLDSLGIEASTARRQFQNRFGMTFVQYARARRMGLAMKMIRKGESIIETQLTAGYESESGFRDAFSKIMGAPPSKSSSIKLFHSSWIDTQLGPMLAVADDQALFLLEFIERRGLEREIERLRKKTNGKIIPGKTDPICSIQEELALYFEKKSCYFKTPIQMMGTEFQKRVWKELCRIPPGETRSYLDVAQAIGKPSGSRAVAQANGSNQLAIIIPCHRVINSNGELGGYGGGVHRKQWMLDHEKMFCK